MCLYEDEELANHEDDAIIEIWPCIPPVDGHSKVQKEPLTFESIKFYNTNKPTFIQREK